MIRAVLAGERVTGRPERPGPDESVYVVPATLVRELLAGSHGPPHWSGIHLEGVLIDGSLDLSYLTMTGAIVIERCRIDGELDLGHATINGKISLEGSWISSVSVPYARVDGPLMWDDLTCPGGLAGVSLKVTGSMRLRRADIRAPADKPGRFAVALFRAEVGDLFLTDTKLRGGFYGNGIQVDRNIRLQGIKASSRKALGMRTDADTSTGAAISLLGAKVDGAIYFANDLVRRTDTSIEGSIVLTRCACRVLSVRAEDLRDVPMKIEGLTYARLSHIEPSEWLEVIQGSTLHRQPYTFLADYCDRLGLWALGKKTRISLEDQTLATRPWTTADRWRGSFWSYSMKYGYRPGLAIPWLIICVALCTLVLLVGGEFMVFKQSAVSTPSRGVHDAVTAGALAIDQLLPFGNIGTSRTWSADPATGADLAWLTLFMMLKLVAWGLAALGLASVTGLARRA